MSSGLVSGSDRRVAEPAGVNVCRSFMPFRIRRTR